MGMNRDILEEAIEILEKSEILKETAIWQSEEVSKLVGMHTEEEVEGLPWDEKERYMEQMEELWGRLRGSVMELKKLSERYEELRLRLKKEYGDERLPPLPPEEIDRLLDEAGEDDGEEDWKKE